MTVAAAALEPARRKQLHVFIATSDLHITHKLRTTREDVLERIRTCVAQARRMVGPDQEVEFSAEDASRSELPFLLEAYEAAVEAGASVINVPDTVGYAEPKEFGAVVKQVVKLVGKRAIVSTHCHNDLGLATANTLAGIQAGARQVEVTVNGLGERAGNASLEEVVMALRTRPTQFRGVTTNVVTEQLTATSRLVSYLTGIVVQPNKSVVGANAFAHESGIHQDGFLKNPLTYEIMTPESVGLSGSTLTLGKLSGRAGFDDRLRRLGIHVEPETLDTLYAEAITLGDQKKQVTDADLLALAEQHADPVPQLVQIEHWAAASRQGESSSGNVSLFYEGRTFRAFAGGNGPGRRAPLGRRQRPRADHPWPAPARRLPAPLDRPGRGRPGRGDGEDLGAGGRGRGATDLHRARPLHERGRGIAAGLPGGDQQAHRRAPDRRRRDRGRASATVRR